MNTFAFFLDGRLLASASDDSNVRFWSGKSGAACRTLDSHNSSVKAVSFLPDGQLLTSASHGGTFKLCSVMNRAVHCTYDIAYWYVTTVAFLLDGLLLAIGGPNVVMI